MIITDMTIDRNTVIFDTHHVRRIEIDADVPRDHRRGTLRSKALIRVFMDDGEALTFAYTRVRLDILQHAIQANRGHTDPVSRFETKGCPHCDR